MFIYHNSIANNTIWITGIGKSGIVDIFLPDVTKYGHWHL